MAAYVDYQRKNFLIIDQFLARGYLDHSPDTFYNSVTRLLPSTSLYINHAIQPERYYCFGDQLISEQIETECQKVEFFNYILKKNFESHYDSSVPIAIPVSSGVDSSGLVAGACYSKTPTCGFTLRVPGSIDESVEAYDTCQLAGINHQKVDFTTLDISQLLIDAIKVNGEPIFGLPEAYQFGLRRHVRSCGYKVLLSGDGGDELYGGTDLRYEYLLSMLLDNRKSDFCSLMRSFQEKKTNRFVWYK